MNPRTLRALLPIAVLAGLSACTATSPTPTPVAASAQTAASAPPAKPSPPVPVPTSPSKSKSKSNEAPARAACPADVAALQRASGLPEGFRVDPDDIRCARRWATAGVIHPDPDLHGDGVIVFEYTAAGKWKSLGEGSAIECTPYGIPEEIGDQVGCHDR